LKLNIILKGGYYNDDFEYIPGPLWDEKNQCYLNEFSDGHLDEEYYDEEGKIFIYKSKYKIFR
jgi:hypothetical protein